MVSVRDRAKRQPLTAVLGDTWMTAGEIATTAGYQPSNKIRAMLAQLANQRLILRRIDVSCDGRRLIWTPRYSRLRKPEELAAARIWLWPFGGQEMAQLKLRVLQLTQERNYLAGRSACPCMEMQDP
jgi:hypothetical protein